MADIRCPNCGQNNPDFLDSCQFCQASLQPDPLLQTGDSPVRKNTGELESVLPQWLKDVRQQGKESIDSAEENVMEPMITPKVQKDAAPDLLAGLASQSSSDDDEVPDWLAGLNPVETKASSASSSEKLSPSDFFAQFEQSEPQSPAPSSKPAKQEESLSWLGENDSPPASQKDELGDWLSQTSDQPSEPLQFGFDSSPSDEWKPPAQTPEPAKEPEDLSWLHDLESSSKQAEAPSSQTDMGWMSNLSSAEPTPSSGQEDMSWLGNLGGLSMASDAPSSPQSASSSQEDDLGWLNNLGGMPSSSNATVPSQPPSSQEDLSWLNNLGGTSAPAMEEPTSTSASTGDDLGWLNNLGGIAASVPEPSQPVSSQEDLGWLKDFGGEASSSAPQESAFSQPELLQPESSQPDMAWLNNLDGTSAPAFDSNVPAQSASSQEDLGWLDNLGSETAQEPVSSLPSTPQSDVDWLGKLGGMPATDESPTIQPFADTGQLNWLNGANQQTGNDPSVPISPFSSRTGPLAGITDDMAPDWLKSATEEPSMPPPGTASMDWFKPQEEEPPLTPPSPAFEATSPASSDNVPSSSNQDIDSMFAVEMPDWLSQKPDTLSEQSAPQGDAPATTPGGDALSPVDLPSWVQAMRPVEAAIGETLATSTDQLTEREGPLAGFRGLIPFAPIGSSRRPKAVSLKLQATEEQQASAVLLEQIIAGETAAHPARTASAISSQRILRIALAFVFWLVLGGVIALGSQNLSIFAPAQVNELSSLIATVPDSSPVLVVMDYQPALVGELEAASGPLLDQLALSRHSQFTFLSTSPNGSALVERLMSNTKLNRPASAEGGGLGYQLGSQYFNIGYLPGDSAGILDFMEDPKRAMPSATVDAFSEFTAVIVLTDHAESSRMWVEQLEQKKLEDSAVASQLLFVVASAQSGPLLDPYVSSGQVDVMISGLSEGAQYEYVNGTRPGSARLYWDAFGIGLVMAIGLIVLGSLWSLITGIRARRAEAEPG